MQFQNLLYQVKQSATTVPADFSPLPGTQLAYLLVQTNDAAFAITDTIKIEINGDVIGGGAVANLPILAVCTATDSMALTGKGPMKWTPPFPITMNSDKALRVTPTGDTMTITAVFIPA